MKHPKKYSLAALVALGVLSLQAQAATLTHRYTFNNNVDDVVGSLDGTATTNTTWLEAPSFVTASPTGAVGITTSIDVGNNAGSKKSGFTLSNSVISTAEGSYSFWIKPDSGSSSAAEYITAAPSAGPQVFFKGGTDTLAGNAGGSTVTNAEIALSSVTDWRQVALTWDDDIGGGNGSVSLYIDGSLVGTDTFAANSIAATELRFGAFNLVDANTVLTSQYKGLIYDLQVYDGALNATEVTTLFNNPGTAIPEPSSSALLIGGVLFAAGLLRRRGNAWYSSSVRLADEASPLRG